MNLNYKSAVCGIFIIALIAGCGGPGGSGSDGEDGNPTDPTNPTNPTDPVDPLDPLDPPIEVTAADGTLTITSSNLGGVWSHSPANGTAPELVNFTFPDPANGPDATQFRSFVPRADDAVPTDFTGYVIIGLSRFQVFRGVTPSGQGEVYSELDAYQFVRRGETNMPDAPVSGTLVYNGGYAGMISDVDSPAILGSVFGNAQLELDFADNIMSGEITDRVVQFIGGGEGEAAPIILNAGSVNDLGFEGTTTGGQITAGRDGPFTASAGTFTGLIVGENGTEVIGQVRTSFSEDNQLWLEQGAFVGASN